jgi:hypothetical protein
VHETQVKEAMEALSQEPEGFYEKLLNQGRERPKWTTS